MSRVFAALVLIGAVTFPTAVNSTKRPVCIINSGDSVVFVNTLDAFGFVTTNGCPVRIK